MIDGNGSYTLKFIRLISLYIAFSLFTLAYAKQGDLSQSFISKSYRYAILYPASWKCADHGKGVVVFKGSGIDPHYPLMINIQTILTKKAGGEYVSVNDLMNDFRSQVPQHTQHAKFIDRNPIELLEPDGSKLYGEETLLTFYENKQTFKQWQIMMVSHDGMLFQAWAYRAPQAAFDANRPIAESMLRSWVIY